MAMRPPQMLASICSMCIKPSARGATNNQLPARSFTRCIEHDNRELRGGYRAFEGPTRRSVRTGAMSWRRSIMSLLATMTRVPARMQRSTRSGTRLERRLPSKIPGLIQLAARSRHLSRSRHLY